MADSAGGTGVVASESDGVLSEAEETGVEVGTSGEVVSEQGDAAEESGEPPTVPGCLCVVVLEALRVPLLQEAHATNLAGHFAF